MKKSTEPKATFKYFIQRIIEAENQEDAIQSVFYGTKWNDAGKVTQYGIDIAYQHEKITVQEFTMLSQLINKMA